MDKYNNSILLFSQVFNLLIFNKIYINYWLSISTIFSYRWIVLTHRIAPESYIFQCGQNLRDLFRNPLFIILLLWIFLNPHFPAI